MSKRPGAFRWLIIFVAFLGTSINYVDRACLSVALPYIEHDLNLSRALLGTLLGAFFWTYALGQLPAGYLIDRLGARVVYAGAVACWSCVTVATAWANSLGALFGLRLLLGAAESPAYPANAKVVSEWFPRSERALATSIFDSGARVGSALTLPIVTTLIAVFGWRAAFVITGLLGVGWCLVWYAMYRPAAEHPRVSTAERAHILECPTARHRPSNTASQTSVRWLALFRYRTVWGMMLGFFCLNFVIYFFITWFPTYLVRERGFTLLQLGAFGTIPALFAIPCGFLGGYASDALFRRGLSLIWARKLPIVIGMVGASSITFAVLVSSAAVALALLAICYGSLAFAAASVWSLPADVAPTAAHVASIGGMQNFASNLAGAGLSSFVGYVLFRTGGFMPALLTAGGFAIVGACCYLFVVGPIEPLQLDTL